MMLEDEGSWGWMQGAGVGSLDAEGKNLEAERNTP